MITGYYWLDALFWSLGGGALGFILGTEMKMTYRKVHRDA